MWREIERVTREETSTSPGSTSEAPGRMSTSSKVSAIALSGKLRLFCGGLPRASANLIWGTGVWRGYRLAASFITLW